MKLLTTVFVLLTASGFAQSAKEMNVKLRESVAQQKEIYETQLQLHKDEAEKQEIIRLESEALYASDLKKMYVKAYNTLNAAESGFETLSKFGYKWSADTVRWFKIELNRISELTALTVNRSADRNFSLESADFSLSDIEGQSLKKQNIILEQRIEEFVLLNARNKGILEKEAFRTKELTSFNLQVKGLVSDYRMVATKAEVMKDNVYMGIAQERDRYQKTGLTGISKEYHQAYKDEFDESQLREGIALSGTSEKPIFKLDGEPEEKQGPRIYDVVDEAAQFPGGIEKLNNYLMANIRYPQIALEFGINAKAYLKFVVTETGKLTDIKITKGIPDCKECDEEAIRLVKGMPDWIPGKEDGKPVNSYYNLPIKFDAR